MKTSITKNLEWAINDALSDLAEIIVHIFKWTGGCVWFAIGLAVIDAIVRAL